MTQTHHHLPTELVLCLRICLPSIVVVTAFVTVKEITANGRNIQKDIPNATLWVETTHPTFNIPKLYFLKEMYM